MPTENNETPTEELDQPTGEQPATEPDPTQTDATGDEAVSAESAAAAEDAPQPGEEAGKKGESLAEALDAAIAGAGPKKVTPKAEADDAAKDLEAQNRNPDGTFKEKKAETPEEKAAREAKERADAEDPVNAPIPEAIKGRTRERMQKLIDTVKAQTELAEQHDALFGAIQSTGASPDEFAAMVGYMRMIHSADPKDLEQAYAVLREELVGVALKLGRPIPEVNLLREKGNEDLIKEIQEGTLTVNRAHEIALQRVGATRKASESTAKTQAERAAADATAAKQQGIDELNDLDKVLRARDGAEIFEAKYAKMVTQEMKDFFNTLDPRTWKSHFLRMYDLIEIAPKAPAAGEPPVKPKPRPQRPSAPAGGGNAAPGAPKSALDAINSALEGM